MRKLLRLTLIIAALAAFVQPSDASEYLDMDICLGKQVVARTLCKDPVEVNYVSQVKENIYLFSVFYADREARFFVGVYKNMIRIQGKDYQTMTRSLPYHFDDKAKCGVVDYIVPGCAATERIVCCSEKTIDEKLDDRFWNRPIPDLLEEDLRKALEASNATGTDKAKPPQEAGQAQ